MSCSISSQGERRAVWPFLGKFLRRPSPVPGCERRPTLSQGSHVAPFPPFASIKADCGETSAPASAPFSAHVWNHPQLTGTCSGCPLPGLGTQKNNTVVSERVYASCKADVGGCTHCPPATTQMKPGPAEAERPRKRQLQLPDANLILPLLPQVTGQWARMAPGGKLLEHSSSRWTWLSP